MALHVGTETVLVVEDEAPVLAMTTEMLLEAGYRVLAAASGEEALALADRHSSPLALLIADIVMPGMSGVALGERLSARYPGLGRLYISGYPGEVLAKRGVNISGDVLLKPFTTESLLGKVRHALDQRRAADST